jgi:hypothetical protein
MPSFALTPLLGILVWTAIVIGVFYVVDKLVRPGRGR